MEPCLRAFPINLPVGEDEVACFEKPMNFFVNNDPNHLAPTQIQARTLMHLLGHSLGIVAEEDVRNDPLTPAPLAGALLAPDTFASWEGLHYAPGGLGTALPEEAHPTATSEECCNCAPASAPLHGLTPRAVELDGDDDGDGASNRDDNCPGVVNPGTPQPDADGDLVGDPCDEDSDGDGVPNEEDPLPMDSDDDGIGNATDPDDDDDAICDVGGPVAGGTPGVPLGGCTVGAGGSDNCPVRANANQADVDGDGVGRSCDRDDDADGFLDEFETIVGSDPGSAASVPELVGFNCEDSLDNDGDGKTDAVDEGCSDTDGDSVPNYLDNCPAVHNVGLRDLDGDETGDACDSDDDGDGVPDGTDACPFTPAAAVVDVNGCAAAELDFDDDGICDPGAPATTHCAGTDVCPLEPDAGQADADGDGIGDACDDCAAVANADQVDTDHDGTGDACDVCTDVDADGFGDPTKPASTCQADNCRTTTNASQANADGDAKGDACDDCPADPDKVAAGSCGCGVADDDSDNDLALDCDDACPGDPEKIALDGCGCSDWEAGLPGLDGEVYTMVVHDDGSGPALFVGGEFEEAGGEEVNFIAKWDGTTWSSLDGGMEDWVRALVVYDGDLIAAGDFDTAGGVAAEGIARWDGSDWLPLGAGTDGSVNALTVRNGGLIAGRRLHHGRGRAGEPGRGVEERHLVRARDRSEQLGGCARRPRRSVDRRGQLHDGRGHRCAAHRSLGRHRWSPLGGGINNQVLALAVYQGDLVAGGFFSEAGGMDVESVARWNGLQWSALGDGIDGRRRGFRGGRWCADRGRQLR